MGVGSGKALATLLMPTVMGAKNPVLLVPSPLEDQTLRIYEDLAQHWKLVPPRIIGYGTLQHPKHHDILEQAQPDLLVLDEAHQAASATSARGKRVRRYLKAFPQCRLCALSGTMIRRGLRDWAYLSYAALRAKSPAPRTWKELEAWGYALDDLGGLPNSEPGVLSQWRGENETVREGYRRRVIETPGVVSTAAQSCDASILIHARKPRVPTVIQEALRTLHKTWERPDGEYFESGLEHQRYAMQLSVGLYLRWKEKPPQPWLEARRAWGRELRARIKPGRAGLDSAALYEAAVTSGRVVSATYAAWDEIRSTYEPTTEVVWLSDFLVQDAVKWAEQKPGIVWTDTPALGKKIAATAGLPYYGDGAEAARRILDVTGGESIVASRRSHGTGRNLQCFTRALMTQCPANNEAWEQTLGRYHRPGQKSDEVEMWTYQHTRDVKDAFMSARSNSAFVRESEGGRPRLWAATCTFDLTLSE